MQQVKVDTKYSIPFCHEVSKNVLLFFDKNLDVAMVNQ